MASDNFMIIQRLRHSDQIAQALTFLSQDVECNLYQIDILQNAWRNPFAFLSCVGVFQHDELTAVVVTSDRPIKGHKAGMCVPYGDPEACFLLGKY